MELFFDDFESESPTGSFFNFSDFTNWSVTDGVVDLIASGEFGVTCPGATGFCVDLDGTRTQAGRLESLSTFALEPGLIYTLSFDISGNQRQADTTDSMDFGLTDAAGTTTVFSDTISKLGSDPLETVSRDITVAEAAEVRLFFDHTITPSDQLGLILDNVQFSVVPVPAAAWLFGSALGLLGWFRRRVI